MSTPAHLPNRSTVIRRPDGTFVRPGILSLYLENTSVPLDGTLYGDMWFAPVTVARVRLKSVQFSHTFAVTALPTTAGRIQSVAKVAVLRPGVPGDAAPTSGNSMNGYVSSGNGVGDAATPYNPDFGGKAAPINFNNAVANWIPPTDSQSTHLAVSQMKEFVNTTVQSEGRANSVYNTLHDYTLEQQDYLFIRLDVQSSVAMGNNLHVEMFGALIYEVVIKEPKSLQGEMN